MNDKIRDLEHIAPVEPIILGIESSCDDTSAAVIKNSTILSNVIAGQKVHEAYGGVVPELASRAHQQNIIPVVDMALKDADIKANEISAIAFTRGPGLMGSLLVGTSFAKGFALALNIPLIEVDHLQAHVLAHFIREKDDSERHFPSFPFLCLLVSGGNSQIIIVRDYSDMKIIGQTIDDAAGEAFDKCAKIMGLPYPGGPIVDKYAQKGNPYAFKFSKPCIAGLDYSFSGLKTSFLYYINKQQKANSNFIQENMDDLCASLQFTINDILASKLLKAIKQTGIKKVAVSGGVSANSGLRERLTAESVKHGFRTFFPKLSYSTDNAAMVAIAGYFKYMKGDFVGQDIVPYARVVAH
ncbi:MAG: tRNA (adenosine(37)-N6)-threonylcarbamoyltransferase complex transferase subunit TsaD [Cytophagaceae bacterium]|jgi:N6-L-threonylcarbamoyladenine synthase|nr:tRNA (adenosine(37)-N6)-threonylcarbamoyltransferase complex transferase subunit TsaD [Cytophagaceae bacterium]